MRGPSPGHPYQADRPTGELSEDRPVVVLHDHDATDAFVREHVVGDPAGVGDHHHSAKPTCDPVQRNGRHVMSGAVRRFMALLQNSARSVMGDAPALMVIVSRTESNARWRFPFTVTD